MTDPQLKSFAARCGRLMQDYGPRVVDTYGQQGPDSVGLLSKFSRYAMLEGVAPEMYVTQPTDAIHYSYHSCNQSAIDAWQPDGTPVVCTHGGLFYVMGDLGGAELANRINTIARVAQKPYFITVYGGLHWTAAASKPKESLYNFW